MLLSNCLRCYCVTQLTERGLTAPEQHSQCDVWDVKIQNHFGLFDFDCRATMMGSTFTFHQIRVWTKWTKLNLWCWWLCGVNSKLISIKWITNREIPISHLRCSLITKFIISCQRRSRQLSSHKFRWRWFGCRCRRKRFLVVAASFRNNLLELNFQFFTLSNANAEVQCRITSTFRRILFNFVFLSIPLHLEFLSCFDYYDGMVSNYDDSLRDFRCNVVPLETFEWMRMTHVLYWYRTTTLTCVGRRMRSKRRWRNQGRT